MISASIRAVEYMINSASANPVPTTEPMMRSVSALGMVREEGLRSQCAQCAQAVVRLWISRSSKSGARVVSVAGLTGRSPREARDAHTVGIVLLLVRQPMHDTVDGIEFCRHDVDVVGITCVVATENCIGNVIGELHEPGGA